VSDAETFRDRNLTGASGADVSVEDNLEHSTYLNQSIASGLLAKRVIDLAISLIAIVLYLPLLLTIALAIRFESAGPAVFRQRRTGQYGRVFTIYKFRTMTVIEDGDAVRYATQQDHRVTALGGFLRKLGLDELPHLWNVVMGEMSLVGPRPHALAHDDYYGNVIETYAGRFRAKPGLTGLAQVNGLVDEAQDLRAMKDRVAADNLYIDSWSLGLDIAILAKTVLIELRGRAAFEPTLALPMDIGVAQPLFSGRGAVSGIRAGVVGAISAATVGVFLWPEAPVVVASLGPTLTAAFCAIVAYFVGRKHDQDVSELDAPSA